MTNVIKDVGITPTMTYTEADRKLPSVFLRKDLDVRPLLKRGHRLILWEGLFRVCFRASENINYKIAEFVLTKNSTEPYRKATITCLIMN